MSLVAHVEGTRPDIGSLRFTSAASRTLTSVFHRLRQEGHDIDLLWARIEGIVTKTIMAMAPMLSFELQRAFSVRFCFAKNTGDMTDRVAPRA